MGLEILSQFLFESSEIIFEKPQKISLDTTCERKFSMNMFVHFGLFESISDERKPIDRDQNFVLFFNMDLEILCLFLFKSSEELFERRQKLFVMVSQQFFCFLISPFSNMLKIVEVGRFVERTLLYKM